MVALEVFHSGPRIHSFPVGVGGLRSSITKLLADEVERSPKSLDVSSRNSISNSGGVP